MNYFVFDASAISRRYFPDISTRIVNQIFELPNKLIITPSLVIPEFISVATDFVYYSNLISETYMNSAINRFKNEITTFSDWIIYQLSEQLMYEASDVILRVCAIPNHPKLHGIDAVYLAIALKLAGTPRSLSLSNIHQVIFVTNDRRLLAAARTEAQIARSLPLMVFNGRTCDMGCGHINEDARPGIRQVCITCDNVCDPCQYQGCPSKYIVRF